MTVGPDVFLPEALSLKVSGNDPKSGYDTVRLRDYWHPIDTLVSPDRASKTAFRQRMCYSALVAELADAPDLKSGVPIGACGFESHPGYTS